MTAYVKIDKIGQTVNIIWNMDGRQERGETQPASTLNRTKSHEERKVICEKFLIDYKITLFIARSLQVFAISQISSYRLYP